MIRRRVPRGEDGIALTVAICSLALMITLGGIALNQAVSALRQSDHQLHVKRALQAADAAVESASYGVSRVDIASTFDIDPTNPTINVEQNCVVDVGEIGGIEMEALDPLTPTGPGGRRWCPETQGSGEAAGTSFSYRISELVRAGGGPCGDTSVVDLDRQVVAVGRSGDVVRRIKADLTSSIALLSGAAVQSASDTSPLAMSGTARILGDARSNGDITGTGLNVISGNATPGEGHVVSGVIPVGADDPACTDFAIPEVDQGDVATNNQNTSYTAGCVNTLTFLPVVCNPPLLPTTGGVNYTPSTRTLEVWGNGRAVLTGANYSFCYLRIRGNGILQIARTTSIVRLFLDDPDDCRDGSGNLVPGAGTINLSEGGRILNCHPETAPESLQIYAVGNPSASLSTTQTLAAATLPSAALRTVACGISLPALLGEPMTVVAPHSRVALGGNMALSGQVAGNVVELAGLASVNPISALVNLDRLGANPVLPLYQISGYVECVGRDFDELPDDDPAQGC